MRTAGKYYYKLRLRPNSPKAKPRTKPKALKSRPSLRARRFKPPDPATKTKERVTLSNFTSLHFSKSKDSIDYSSKTSLCLWLCLGLGLG